MIKIRIGNTFIFVWEITRNGLLEDLSNALDMKLTASVFKRAKDVQFTLVDKNKLVIKFTPEICDVTGIYNLELSYTLGTNKCTVDKDAFMIVPISSEADDPSEFTLNSDLVIGLKGDIGPVGPMPDLEFSLNENGELQYTILNQEL